MSNTETATELFELALDCLKEGNVQMAIELFSQSLHREKQARTYFERARLYHRIGKLKSAAEDVGRAIPLCKPFSKDWVLLPKLNFLCEQITVAQEQERKRKALLKKLSQAKDLNGLLTACQLTPFSNAIIKQSEMSVRISLRKGIATGSKSRFGGLPDLPSGVTWPISSTGYALSFLGQISLPDLTNTCASKLFGGEGLLSFFYDAEAQPWGYASEHRSGTKVFHFHELATLAKREYPSQLPNHCRFNECTASFEEELTFPSDESGTELQLSSDESLRYSEFCQSWYGDSPHHHLLGQPQLIQGSDWKRECQLASNGIFSGDAGGYTSEQATELEARAEQWQLLLQVDTDEMTGMEWGDGGSLYFCINQSELERNDLSNVWTILQCL